MITTLLVLVNIFNSVNATTPSEAGGLTALATWIVACIIFAFTFLMSYVFILLKMKIPNSVKKDDPSTGQKQFLQEPAKPKILDLDMKLLLTNMLVFILFAILYWVK